MKCAYGALFSLWCFLVNKSTKSAQNPIYGMCLGLCVVDIMCNLCLLYLLFFFFNLATAFTATYKKQKTTGEECGYSERNKLSRS